MVVQAHVRLRHEGCASTALPEDASLVHLGDGDDTGLALLRGKTAEATREALERMRRHAPDLVVVEGSPCAALVRCPCETRAALRAARAQGGLPAAPTTWVGGSEHLTLLATSREGLEPALRVLAGLGSATVSRLVELPLEALDPPIALGGFVRPMSPRQMRALRAAIQAGYYDRPRVVNAQDLARGVGLARSTYLEHLRKAEECVMRTLGGALTDHPAFEGDATKGPGRPPRRPPPSPR